ncbi:hypothetical protein BKA93DRAFT_841997 [Sparassis latifolia]
MYHLKGSTAGYNFEVRENVPITYTSKWRGSLFICNIPEEHLGGIQPTLNDNVKVIWNDDNWNCQNWVLSALRLLQSKYKYDISKRYTESLSSLSLEMKKMEEKWEKGDDSA